MTRCEMSLPLPSEQYVCRNSFVIHNEDYAVLAGVLGGILLFLLYFVTLKVMDIRCQRYSSDLPPAHVSSLNVNMRPADVAGQRERHVAGGAVSSFARNDAASSFDSPTPRRVRFDSNVVAHAAGPDSPGAPKGFSAERRGALTLLGGDGEEDDDVDGSCAPHARGCTREDVFSPPPKPPRRR